MGRMALILGFVFAVAAYRLVEQQRHPPQQRR
jgi:hypothetical protein